jgi:lysozyme family protein
VSDPRRPFADALRNAGVNFNRPGVVAAFDEMLDAAGIERAGPPASAPTPAPPLPAASTFDRALVVVLKHESGYVNHPQDPGGRTNLGVTQRVWENWVGRKVTEAEMRALTPAMVAPLYRKEYWDACRCGDMAPAVALVVFDMAVNAGVHRAVVLMQRIVGTAQDGRIGPLTLNAIGSRAPRALVASYSEARRVFYRGLRTFPTFGRGWLRRTDEVEQEALRWI